MNSHIVLVTLSGGARILSQDKKDIQRLSDDKAINGDVSTTRKELEYNLNYWQLCWINLITASCKCKSKY